MTTEPGCQLCTPADVVCENDLAYCRYDSAPLTPGHVIVVPKRHVAGYFDMTTTEKHAVVALLDQAKAHLEKTRRPEGYNIGANIGVVAGQNRMHVHVHLIPRFSGDVPDPRGGVRCVVPKKAG
jgi:diadenosine tetraphosphate (Ap4A) HIT family hydrolase